MTNSKEKCEKCRFHYLVWAGGKSEGCDSNDSQGYKCVDNSLFEPKESHKDQVDAVAMGFNIEAVAETGKALHESFLDMFAGVRVIPDTRYKGNQYGVHVSPEIFQELKKRQ